MANPETRDRLLRAGFDLFFERGYNATGVSEIVGAIGVPKGSFYTYFASKDALACEVIDDFRERAIVHLSQLASATGSPVSRLRGHFRELSENTVANNFRGGCLLGNFSAEMADQSDTIRARLSAAFGSWQDAIAELIRQAHACDEIASPSDSVELAAVLLNSFEGAVLRARADRSEAPFGYFDKVFEMILDVKGARNLDERQRGYRIE